MSCLIFLITTIILGISFMRLNLNWIFYIIIQLYIGGIMVLFVYICSLSSMDKIELGKIAWVILIYMVIQRITSFLSSLEKRRSWAGRFLITMFYSNNNIIVLLGWVIILTIGLVVRVFFLEKQKGPIKS